MNKVIYKIVFMGILCAYIGATTLNGQVVTADTTGAAYATIQVAEVVAMLMMLLGITKKKKNKC